MVRKFFGTPSRWVIVCLLLGLLVAPLHVFAVNSNGDPVDLDVRDADVRKVFLDLAAKAKINILLSPKIRGTITCRIKDMDPLELILFIARTNAFEVEDHGNILMIMTETPPGSKVRIEVINLQNATAEEVEKIIQNLKLDKKAKVTHDKRTNRLIVAYEEL